MTLSPINLRESRRNLAGMQHLVSPTIVEIRHAVMAEPSSGSQFEAVMVGRAAASQPRQALPPDQGTLVGPRLPSHRAGQQATEHAEEEKEGVWRSWSWHTSEPEQGYGHYVYYEAWSGQVMFSYS